MTERLYEAAKVLFLRALRVPVDGRAAFVAGACGGDDVLREEVEALLESHGAGDAELGDEDVGALDALAGRVVGSYRLLWRIGAGAMGVVYAAEQHAPRRRVAVKVVRSIAAGPSVLRRFRLESEALGRLRHPGIAQVHEAGTVEIDGVEVPFLAMELVEHGRPITHHADEERLDLRARLELLVAVCDAVHHGHVKGVIHRDLKPDNILIDGDGRPRLIDFGVARVLDTDTVLATVRTRPGQIVGTLQYMAPEQCAGGADLDTRGDVYSLGAVLYELVCGRPPHDLSADSLVTAIRRVAEEVPPPPARLVPGLPRGVDLITRKALAKRREDRYGSAHELGQDLRAYLEGRAVSASPPSAWRRTVDWIGRHPAWSTLALCGLIASASGVAIAWTAHRFAALPDRVLVDASGTYVRLESRARLELNRWQTDRPKVWPLPVRQPAALGGRELVLIAHAREQGGSCELCAYDARRTVEEPVWTTAGGLGALAPVARGRGETRVIVEVLLVADFFPAQPGDEVLVTQRLSPDSHSAIRIFDLAGRQRFCVWHLGAIHGGWWMPAAGRLVLAGLNSRVPWRQRGVDVTQWPCVVFALDPRDGHEGAFPCLSGEQGQRDPTLAWYRWFGPIDAIGAHAPMRVRTGEPRGRFDDGRHVGVAAGYLLADGRFEGLVAFELDADGQEVGRWPSQMFRDDPAVAALRLLDLAELPPPR